MSYLTTGGTESALTTIISIPLRSASLLASSRGIIACSPVSDTRRTEYASPWPFVLALLASIVRMSFSMSRAFVTRMLSMKLRFPSTARAEKHGDVSGGFPCMYTLVIECMTARDAAASDEHDDDDARGQRREKRRMLRGTTIPMDEI